MARDRPKLARTLTTPEGVTLNLRLASAGARAGAFILDCLLLMGILIGATLLAGAFHMRLGTQMGGIIQIIWLLGAFALRNFFFILGEAGARSATLGKRVVGLRVVARDGGRLTGGAIVARNLMREIEVFLPLMFTAYSAAEGVASKWTAVLGLLWAGIFLFFPLFNRDRLRAGDLIAGTWVIETERRRIGADLLAAEPAAAAPPAFDRAALDAYGEYELHRLEEVLRRDDADAITTVAATIRAKIGHAAAGTGSAGDDRAFLNAYYRALRQHLERRMLMGTRKADKFAG
ncbi:RDD family protein [Sphingomonas baiyangensis]|uniref:RDD family protein n=1 Tax=Sphingomonas baiyangensis TaxID=2572576 RepID=A0A4U1L9B4_9SPHN|nr:RDD family protein [Sphingomonas baiyangensis]TKD53133.1 RDD family protein [Sphingomonas baiyangensis]